jgi:small subunit ribosomal protein S1
LNTCNRPEHSQRHIHQALDAEDTASVPSDQSPLREQTISMEGAIPLAAGQLVSGVFIAMQGDVALVSIGGGIEAIIPAENMQSLQGADFTALTPGSELSCIVVRVGNNESSTILSVDKAFKAKEWQILHETLERGSTVQGIIIRTNQGGCLVKLNSLQGFVPLSQMSLGTQLTNTPTPNKPSEEGNRIGQTLLLKILEVDKPRNRIVLSERAVVNDQRAAQKAKLLSELQEGQLVTGHVSGITEFGAFVDLGFADGLIHISELSWASVGTVSELLELGQEVTASVLQVDTEKSRIALSLRRAQPEPWETVEERYEAGQAVDGTVTKLTEFGAFARVESGIEGLIHISEISQRTIRHPSEVLSEGDVVSLKVIAVDAGRRRLGLSLKQAVEEV